MRSKSNNNEIGHNSEYSENNFMSKKNWKQDFNNFFPFIIPNKANFTNTRINISKEVQKNKWWKSQKEKKKDSEMKNEPKQHLTK